MKKGATPMLAAYQLGQLGACSVIPSSQDCVVGSQSVNLMDQTYQALPAGSQAQYQQQHDALMTAFNAQYSSWMSWIPFNPSCCAVEQIGEQADNLTSQMTGGAVTGPSVTPSGIPLPSLPNVTTLLIVAGVLALLIMSKK
jgi:hypothetical protein